MPEIRPYQQCRSLEGWHPIAVPSSTDPDQIYTVLVNPWGTAAESICECKGYTFGGKCKHQRHALKDICGWSEIYNPERQTPEQRVGMVCPCCLSPTSWEMEVVEDDD